MTRKTKKTGDHLVYSTDPDTMSNLFHKILPTDGVTDPENQELRVWIDKKSRSGKVVTLIKGFSGTENAIKDLAKFLKVNCGVGGSVKNGEILIQGNHRDKIVDLLKTAGYTQTKKAGG